MLQMAKSQAPCHLFKSPLLQADTMEPSQGKLLYALLRYSLDGVRVVPGEDGYALCNVLGACLIDLLRAVQRPCNECGKCLKRQFWHLWQDRLQVVEKGLVQGLPM